jgi:antitoxin component YwqK of YwqJK toxin-antitoxin module
MEKLLVICCILISLGFSARTQENVNDYTAIDSVDLSAIESNNVAGNRGTDDNISKDASLNLPDKGSRVKKKSARNGLYVVLNERGDTQFVSNYRKGQLNGQWISWFNNRNVCDSGLLVDDLPDGTWKGWYANGNPKYILQFSARKLNALKDELIRQPKTKYFILSQKLPEEASRHYNALLLFGHKPVDNNSILMTKKVNLPSYSSESLRDIVVENTNERNRSFYKAPFTEGLLHGQFTSFHSNGAIKETGLYLNGLREGIWEEYNQQKEKAIGTYRHGYRNGEWRYYNSQGKLVFWKRFDAKGRETEKFSFAAK